jgi:glutaredoxin
MMMVYSTPSCGACKQVKEYLRSKDIPFSETDLTKLSGQVQMMLMGRLGRLSVPIIEVDKKKFYYSLSELKEVYGS